MFNFRRGQLWPLFLDASCLTTSRHWGVKAALAETSWFQLTPGPVILHRFLPAFGIPQHVTFLVFIVILYGLDLWETHWRSSSVSHLRTLLLIIFYLVLGALVGSGLYVSWPFFEGGSRRPDIASWIYLGFVEGWGYVSMYLVILDSNREMFQVVVVLWVFHV